MKSEVLSVEKLEIQGGLTVRYKGVIRFSHRGHQTDMEFTYPADHTHLTFDLAFGNRMSISRFDFGLPESAEHLCFELNLYKHEEPVVAREFCDFITQFPALLKMMDIHSQ